MGAFALTSGYLGAFALTSGHLGDFALMGDQREAERGEASCAFAQTVDGCELSGVGGGHTLAQLVDVYLHERAHRLKREEDWWGDPSLSFEQACRRAFFALENERKRDTHQWTMSSDELAAMARRLAASERSVCASQTFNELYRAIEQGLGVPRNAKPLLIYDVARRLGLRLKLAPVDVYLHRGAAKGAEALRPGLGRPRRRPLGDFPTSIRARLTPDQTEDFLCVARAYLSPELWD